MELGTNTIHQRINEIGKLCQELRLDENKWISLDPDKLFRNLQTLRRKLKYDHPQHDLGE